MRSTTRPRSQPPPAIGRRALSRPGLEAPHTTRERSRSNHRLVTGTEQIGRILFEQVADRLQARTFPRVQVSPQQVNDLWRDPSAQFSDREALVADRWLTFDCFGTLIDWRHGIRTTGELLFPGRGQDFLDSYITVEAEVENEGSFRRYRAVLTEASRRAPSRDAACAPPLSTRVEGEKKRLVRPLDYERRP